MNTGESLSTHGSSPARSRTRSTSKPRKSTSRRLVAANDNFIRYRDASRTGVYAGACELAGKVGAIAWSLNFSKRLIRQLEAHACAGKSPVRLLSEYLRRELCRHLGFAPPFAFGLEYCPEERLHAHGVLALQGELGQNLKLVREALRAAGGRFPKLGHCRQADTRDLFNGQGWFNYGTKSLARTRRLLGHDTVVYINQQLQQMTKQAWSTLDAARSTKAAFRRNPPRATLKTRAVASACSRVSFTLKRLMSSSALEPLSRPLTCPSADNVDLGRQIPLTKTAVGNSTRPPSSALAVQPSYRASGRDAAASCHAVNVAGAPSIPDQLKAGQEPTREAPRRDRR